MWFPLFVDPRLSAVPADGPTPGPSAGTRPVDADAAALRWLEGAGAIPVTSAADLTGIRAGDLVDLVGEAHGNPMVRVLDFVATSMAVLDEVRGASERPATRGRPRAAEAVGPDAAGTTPEAQRLVAVLAAAARDDLRRAAVADVVMFSEDLPVVMSLDRQLTGPGTEAVLDSGRYRVIGKVSEVFGEGEGLSLLRRTVLGATGLDGGREMLAELAERGVELAVTDPVVEGPALALIPLAILS